MPAIVSIFSLRLNYDKDSMETIIGAMRSYKVSSQSSVTLTIIWGSYDYE